MANDRLTTKIPQNSEARQAARRRWNCPTEETIAAYLDGAMEPQGKRRMESHLANCEFCCHLVADVVKLHRLDVAALPAGLIQNAIAFGSAKSRRLRWILFPAAATVGVVIVVVVTLMPRSPEQPVAPFSTAPAAPVIAKSEPPPTLKPPGDDVVRNFTSADTLPGLVFPKQDTAVARDLLKFKWKAVSRTRYYEVRVVTPEGDLVWEGQSEIAVLKFPSDVTLHEGAYFVWISAYLDDGRVRRSAPVRFLISTSR